jgi:radical SAM protein
MALTAPLRPRPMPVPQGPHGRFERHPALVFWETTRACLLACRHCRARAQRTPLPGELTTAEGVALLRSIAAFDPPRPVVVFTGGDLLMRRDIFTLVEAARDLGLVTAVSPSVTPLLTARALRRFAQAGVHGLSLSLDAMQARHDALRGVPDTFAATLRAMREALDLGLSVQVNTVVSRDTLPDLGKVAGQVVREGVRIWEVFFLVPTGRAQRSQTPGRRAVRDVVSLLLLAGAYGLEVRTVEGPWARLATVEGAPLGYGPWYRQLAQDLVEQAGEPVRDPTLSRGGTLDGDGILFVGYDGTVYPGGLLPVPLGNVRETSLVTLYRTHPLLRAIRQRDLAGRCGVCRWRFACGGSRARAQAVGGHALGDDPLCPWPPAFTSPLPAGEEAHVPLPAGVP